jgi:hypothetical protein
MNIEDTEIFVVERYGKRPPSLFIELPHGAVHVDEFQHFANLIPSLPKNLVDFFLVNTDVGTPELAQAIAENLKEEIGVVILRSKIPRTLVDCNRVLSLSEDEYRAGKVTPGIPCYVPNEHHRWLIDIHHRYTEQATSLYKEICANGGFGIMLHSYAPKSVGISQVGHDIVEKLHWAYREDMYKTWPTRPEIDIIGRTKEGDWLCNEGRALSLQNAFEKRGFQVELSKTYPMHPSTTAFRHASSYPDQTLCLEIRRDILMKEFIPFRVLEVDQVMISNIAECIGMDFLETNE